MSMAGDRLLIRFFSALKKEQLATSLIVRSQDPGS